MQVYLVGGAVRDQLLGRPIKDKDFVVVGTTVTEMLAAGFHQVGADFPVFLHPTSKKNMHWRVLSVNLAMVIRALVSMPAQKSV